MARFHINPETGEPGRCYAQTDESCRFKNVSEHFESAAEARASYEEEMESRENHSELKGHSKLRTFADLRAELLEKGLALEAIMDERRRQEKL